MKFLSKVLLCILFSSKLSAMPLNLRLAEHYDLIFNISQSSKNTRSLEMVSKGRASAFSLEAFGRLFEASDKEFKLMKEDFKELEDQIGQCKKWLDLSNVEINQDKKMKLKNKLDDEMKKLDRLLLSWDKKDKWNDYLKFIENVEMSSDRAYKYFKIAMSEEIKTLLEKKYDFTYGETGLHELRRNIRWSKIYLKLFKDRIYKAQEDCKIDELYELGLQEDDVDFTGNKNEFQISSCGYLKLVGAIEKLGQIKDELEEKEILEDKVPRKIKDETIKLHNQIKKSILPKLILKD